MSIKTFIPWYGGKHKMAADLLSFIPFKRIETFVEVFGGGMRVLINKPFSPMEVYNDLDTGLVAIFNCMKDINKAKELRRKLWETPYSFDAFNYAMQHNNDPELSEIERARIKYVLITQSFNSACKNWRQPTSPNVLKTYNKRIVDMVDFVPRFKRIIIENMDFEDLISKYDSATTFFYLDPPYIGETRGAPKVYEHEGDDSLHIRMVNKLLSIEGMALVSGYDHKLYDQISIDGWKKIKLGDYAKSSQNTMRGDSKDKGKEFIWKNY